MVSSDQTHIGNEPTPVFNERCMNVVLGWERRELPFEDAINYLTAFRQEAIEDDNFVNEARAEQLLGYVQHYRGNLTMSIRHWQHARELYERVNNYNRIATVDLNLGESYRYKGEFNRALRLYESAYKVAESLGNIQTQTIAAVNQGLVLLTIDEDDTALEAFESGLKLAEQWDPEALMLVGLLCELHDGMARVYLRRNATDLAWDHALMALAIAEKDQQPLHLGFANRTLGEVMTVLEVCPVADMPTNPDHYFRIAMQAFREIEAEAELARSMFAQARSLMVRGRRTAAAKELQEVMILFSNLGLVYEAGRAADAQRQVL